MQSMRSNLVYTAFATAVFTGIQYLQDVHNPWDLLITAAMFFLFTFFMLRLINRIMMTFTGNAQRRRQERIEADRGPAEVAATTSRPDHVRRRRERRERSRRRR